MDGFIGNEGGVRKFEDCITIANSGSVGSAFFHQYKFVASDHVTQLKRKGLDKYAYLFMVPIINRLSEKYSFNREINDERIKREKILLPVNKKGEIDFNFMSSFMQEVEADILKTTLKVFKKRLNTNENKMGGVKWKAFILSDIFTISAGKRLTKANMKQGVRPFIGATDSNNGITAWVENTNESLDRKVLGVNYNGSVVETFYHPYECIFSDDVKRLHLKDSVKVSHYIMLFLKTMIVQQKIKFAYGYKFNEKRMQMQKIVLPINLIGQPNWDYMETYMLNLEQKQILEYLKHIER